MKRLFFFLLVAAVPLAFSASDDKVVQEMVDGASHFLGGLQEYQRGVAAFEFDDEERFNWHYIPRERKGLPLKEMSPDQRKLANRLLVTGLSSRGAQRALDIMFLDHILFELERRAIRDPDRYFLTVFGEPSASGDWGWRIEGHHLSLNFSIRNGRLASASPLFMGSNPAIVRDGPHEGMQVLAEEELMGRELLHTFAERSQVLIQTEAPEDILTRASRRAEIGTPQGVALSAMEVGQKDLLMRLIGIYAHRLRPEIAEAEMARIDKRGTDSIHFAWAGSDVPGEPHYYRIQGPTFLIEYDNTQNGANHAHSVWRDLTGDFGLSTDPLTDHYAKSPHHQHQRADLALSTLE